MAARLVLNKKELDCRKIGCRLSVVRCEIKGGPHGQPHVFLDL